MTYIPKFPNAPHNYDAQNEAQFRSVVTRALSDTFGGINNRLSSGTGFPTSILGWTHDIGFAATDNDTVSWGTGNITLTDGTTYNIASGNTGNMTTVTYIFLDIGVSATTLQVTTTATDTVGANRILVAVAQNVEAGKDAQFQVFGGADSQKLSLITADVVAADTLTANEIAANTITATEIAAGTITANEILANTITAAEIAAGTITADEIEADTITANEIAAVTITGDEIASLNISTKTITADTGTIGGWTLSSSALSAGNVSINASTERILMGSATAPTTGVGIFMGLDVADYEFRVGDPGGAYMHWDGTNLTINSPSIVPAPVLATPSIYGWGHDIVFSATDNDTVAWGSGTISLTDGATTYSIGAGNTGNMTQITYIYLDTDVSTVALQTTTTAATAVGANKILVAVAQDVVVDPVSPKDAQFQVFGGADDQKLELITADVIAADVITGNEIASNTITAAEIAAVTITGDEIASLNISTKTITADTGTIGGWTLSSSDLSSGSVSINATSERLLFGAATAPLTGTGIFLGKDGANYEFRCGNPAGEYIHWDGGALTVGGTIVSDSFTASDPIFDGSVTVKANDGYNRVKIWSSANYGAISFYDGVSANEAGSVWGSSSYGLHLAAVDGNIEFEGATGFGSVSSAVLYNNGDVFGPKLVDGASRGTAASTSYVDISATLSWAGDGSFIGSVTEFSGKVTGTNSTKGVRITAGGSSAVLFSPASGDTGSWHVKVMIAEITTSSQRVVAQWTAPDGTSGVYNATRVINTLTTAFTLVCGGYTANASDEVTCNLTISRSMCNDGS